MNDRGLARRIVDSGLPATWSETVWKALDDDFGCYILVLDDGGEVLFMNAAAAEWLERSWPDEAADLYLSDLMTPDVAAERSEYLHEVLLAGTPMYVDGIIRGEGLRCAMRRLPAHESNRRCVLMSFRPLDHTYHSKPENGWPLVIAAANDLGILSRLTPRETEVLALVARGLSSHEVAFRLRRSRRTIDCHRAAISQKLDIHNVAELAMLASRAGLVRYTHSETESHGPTMVEQPSGLLNGILHPKRFSKQWSTKAHAVA